MKKMKRVVFLSLILVLAATAGFAAEAEPQEDIEIFIEGKRIDPEVPPRIQNGRTLVPARFMFEPLGAEMGWDGKNRIASATLEGRRIEMPIGSTEATINGEVEKLKVPAQIFDNRTYVPLRFSGEAFGRNVHWDDETRTITITSDKALPPETDFDSLNLALFGQCTATGIEMEQEVWIRETGPDEIDFRMELYSEGDLWLLLIYNHEEGMGYTYSGDTGEWEAHDWTVEDLREEENFEVFWELANKHDEGEHFMDETIEWEVQTIERNIEIEDDKFTPPDNEI